MALVEGKPVVKGCLPGFFFRCPIFILCCIMWVITANYHVVKDVWRCNAISSYSSAPWDKRPWPCLRFYAASAFIVLPTSACVHRPLYSNLDEANWIKLFFLGNCLHSKAHAFVDTMFTVGLLKFDNSDDYAEISQQKRANSSDLLILLKCDRWLIVKRNTSIVSYDAVIRNNEVN